MMAAKRVIPMPWQGRNAAIIAARQARPMLPPGWGNGADKRVVLGAPARATAGEPPPLLQLGRLARSGTTFAKQIEALLHLLAERGMSLPRTSEIAVALGLDATQEAQGKVGQAMLYLSKTGRIKRCTPSAGPYKGEAAVMLVETGRIICSPLMPLSAVVFAP